MDLIDRQAAIDAIINNSYPVRYDFGFTSIENGMTVTGIKQALNDLPSVQPQRQTGYLHLLDECANAGYYCSKCQKKVVKEGWSKTVKKIKFCPNCGCKMEVANE